MEGDFVMKIIEKFVALFRGIVYKFRYKINNTKLLYIYPRVHVHKKKGAKIVLGNKCSVFHDVGLYLDDPKACIMIGNNTYFNRRTEIHCMEKVVIGDNCAISWDVNILDTDYHHIDDNEKISLPIHIGNHVWVGCKSTILKGVTIGDGAVIAAGALVNKNVPPKCLVGGVPARILKYDVNWE